MLLNNPSPIKALKISLTICLFLIGLPALVLAGEFTAFGPDGPENFIRETGAPVTVTKDFEVLNHNTEFILRVYNGGLEDTEAELVSSSIISINGTQVVGPEEFNQNVYFIEEPVTLQANNTIDVEVRGKPGGLLTIHVVGIDNTAPNIQITDPPEGLVTDINPYNIQLIFNDDISGINPDSFNITINDADKTNSFTVTTTDLSGSASGAPLLPEGVNVINASISDFAGNTSSATCSFTIQVLEVTAKANPTSGYAPMPVSFSAETKGTITLYEWDFDGDGTYDFSSSSSPNTVHTYNQLGTFNAVIRITGVAGQTLTDTIAITVQNPLEAFANASPTTGTAPLTVTFMGSGIDQTGTIAKYEWDFNGDGYYDWWSAFSQNAYHTYYKKGTYTAVLRLTDNNGFIDTDSIVITVNPAPPVATASAVPTSGGAPLTVNFTGTGTDPDGTIVKYEWDFEGDGTYDWSSTTTGTTSNTYNIAGTYNAILRVTDNDGLTDTDMIIIAVSQPGSPTASASAKPTSGKAPLTVDFSGTATDPDPDGYITKYEWDFDGDGTYDWSVTSPPEDPFQDDVEDAVEAGVALSFDGVNDYVGQPPGFPTIMDTFTMELWAYPLSTRATTPEANQGISGTSNQRYAIFPDWEAGYGTNSGHAGAGISVGTNGISVFEHAHNYLPSPFVFDTTLTGWNHIVLVYEDKQPKLYLNGEFIKTGLTSTKIVHPSKNRFGGYRYGWFNGLIDEVAIYNRALTAEEIQQRYQKTSVPTQEHPSGMVSYWKFDEGSGTIAGDSIGPNDGTLYGATWTSGKVDGWTATGLWHRSQHHSKSGAWAWYYGQEVKWNYDTGTTNSGSLISPVIDLTGVSSPVLTFWRWFQTEGGSYWDVKYVQISANGGAWTTLKQIYTLPGTWVKEEIDLSSYANKQIQIRFYFNTRDALYNYFEGWYIDDITITAGAMVSHTYNEAGHYDAVFRATDNTNLSATAVVPIDVGYNISLSVTPDSFNPSEGGTTNLNTTLFGGDINFTVLVKDKNGNIVKTLPSASEDPRGNGSYTDAWDGTNNQGIVVPDEVYYFVIEYITKDGETHTYDLTATTGGTQRTLGGYSASFPGNFSPYEDQFCPITYYVPYKGEVTAYICPFFPSYTGEKIKALLERVPQGKGSHTVYWDGTNDQGQMAQPTGPQWSYYGYLVAIWSWDLSDNSVIVTGTKPVVSNVSAEPNYFDPSYHADEPVGYRPTTVTYTLSKNADVTLYVYDLNNVLVRSITKTNVTAGTNTIDWDGRNSSGELVAAGQYKLGIKAIDGEGNKSVTVYCHVVVFY